MKKFFAFILIFAFSFIYDCKENNDLSFNLNNITSITIVKEYNKGLIDNDLFSKYNDYLIKEEDINDFLFKMNNLKFTIDEEYIFQTITEANYIIKYDDKEINVISNISFIMEEKKYDVVSGDFDFLNEIDFELNEKAIELSLSDLSFTLELLIYNVEMNKYKIIDTEIELTSFKDLIKKIKYVQSSKEIKDYLYRIECENIVIYVYNDNYFKYNDVIYYVCNEDLSFLNEYEYSESVGTGWLPWV